jgi:hypothetical protein
MKIEEYLKTKTINDFSEFLNNININLNFTNKKNIIESMEIIEILHWLYLDEFNKKNEKLFPYIKFKEFTKKVILKLLGNEFSNNYNKYLTIYNDYQQSRKKAGAIIHYDLDLLLVKTIGSNKFSFPKGKQDINDINLYVTAIREVKEETGIDISNMIVSDMYEEYGNTRYYIIILDNKIYGKPNFKEIEQVKYFNENYILNNKDKFTSDVIKYINIIKKQDIEVQKEFKQSQKIKTNNSKKKARKNISKNYDQDLVLIENIINKYMENKSKKQDIELQKEFKESQRIKRNNEKKKARKNISKKHDPDLVLIENIINKYMKNKI